MVELGRGLLDVVGEEVGVEVRALHDRLGQGEQAR